MYERCKKLLNNEKGTAAIEFSLVALPLFFLIFVTLEVGWIMIQRASANGAMEMVTRQIYLGRTNGGRLTQADLEEFFCDRASTIPSCQQNTLIEMQVVKNFNSFPNTAAACRDSDVPIDPNVAYENGDESEIVFMRMCIRVPLLTPVGAKLLGLQRTASGKYSIVLKTAFVNRKYAS